MGSNNMKLGTMSILRTITSECAIRPRYFVIRAAFTR